MTALAGAVWLSPAKQEEIDLCLGCPLPDCVTDADPRCPLYRAEGAVGPIIRRFEITLERQVARAVREVRAA